MYIYIAIVSKRKNNIFSKNLRHKTVLLHEAWRKALNSTNQQFGARLLYAILLKNPRIFAPFEEHLRTESTSTTMSQNRRRSNTSDISNLQQQLIKQQKETTTQQATLRSRSCSKNYSNIGTNILLSYVNAPETTLLMENYCFDEDLQSIIEENDNISKVRNFF